MGIRISADLHYLLEAYHQATGFSKAEIVQASLLKFFSNPEIRYIIESYESSPLEKIDYQTE